MDVTEESLASALEGFYVNVRHAGAHTQVLNAQLYDAGETAAALYATLSRMAGLRAELDPGEPDAELAAIELILDTLAALGDSATVKRILRYLSDRFRTPGVTP